jgi:diadenosine tetraphosphatase ApaH/serine/threonine PP2A family protein phosphatase
VAGNHDYGAVGKTSINGFNSSASRALQWTSGQLTDGERLYLENLALVEDDGPMRVVHSSPSDPDAWEYVFTLGEADAEMASYSNDMCVVGHSHYPFVVERALGEPARLVRQETVELRRAAKYFINAGSVGQPRDGDPRSCCLLLDPDSVSLTFLRVVYDVAAVQRKILAAGLPEFLASRLALGR